MDNLLLWIITIITTLDKREGELIFRYLYHYIGCTVPFVRLWISSLTDKAIREGLKHLEDGSKYDNLYHAAKARSEADWLVGINGTQALSRRHCPSQPDAEPTRWDVSRHRHWR